MLFAHLKGIVRLGRLRSRGSCGAQFEFMLAVYRVVGVSPSRHLRCCRRAPRASRLSKACWGGQETTFLIEFKPFPVV
jgi:hypothetical protein